MFYFIYLLIVNCKTLQYSLRCAGLAAMEPISVRLVKQWSGWYEESMFYTNIVDNQTDRFDMKHNLHWNKAAPDVGWEYIISRWSSAHYRLMKDAENWVAHGWEILVCWCGDIGCLLYTGDHLIFIDPPFCHLRAAACSCVMISLCLFNCSVYVDQIACGETDWQHQYLHHHNPTTTTTTSTTSNISSTS